MYRQEVSTKSLFFSTLCRSSISPIASAGQSRLPRKGHWMAEGRSKDHHTLSNFRRNGDRQRSHLRPSLYDYGLEVFKLMLSPPHIHYGASALPRPARNAFSTAWWVAKSVRTKAPVRSTGDGDNKIPNLTCRAVPALEVPVRKVEGNAVQGSETPVAAPTHSSLT